MNLFKDGQLILLIFAFQIYGAGGRRLEMMLEGQRTTLGVILKDTISLLCDRVSRLEFTDCARLSCLDSESQ